MVAQRDVQHQITVSANAVHDGSTHAGAGGWDGVLHALSTVDGHEIWQFDTAHEFAAVNGVAAKGGSLGAPGPVIAAGMLFVGSGYVGTGNGMPGNVLLALTPK